MKTLKRILSITIILAILATICVMSTVSSAASGTGAGLSEWCLNAYNSGWSYVYGGCTPGTVDCSGLIYSYAGGIRTGDAQLYNSDYIGYVSNGVPRIHGLGLWQPGHVGVYVGSDMAVDARGSQWGVCYESVYSHGWTKYFKVPGVSYPTTGWVTVNGADFYYENGQYLADTTRTIDGISYTFASSGKCTSNGPSSTPENNTSSTTESTSTNSSTLKKGSTGEAVKKLQERLQELGYYAGIIDGDFGDGTEEAFKLFQQAAGLYVDGLAGSDVEYLYSNDAPVFGSQDEKLLVVDEKDDEELAQTGVNENDETNEVSETEEISNFYTIGDAGEEVVRIQERLAELNYYSGEADGAFGNMTAQSITAFQAANGITQSGEANEYTLNVLFSDEAVANKITEEMTLEVVESELPQNNNDGTDSAIVHATEGAPATEVALETTKLSEKALAGIADTMSFESDSNGNNFQFIFWLLVMIAVMGITFVVINTKEKKKHGKKVNSKYF